MRALFTALIAGLIALACAEESHPAASVASPAWGPEQPDPPSYVVAEPQRPVVPPPARAEDPAFAARLAELERACEASKSEPPKTAAPPAAAAAPDLVWVHANCERVARPPIVECKPLCMAAPRCPEWHCSSHQDWADAATLRDCDPNRDAAARAVSADDPCARLRATRRANGL